MNIWILAADGRLDEVKSLIEAGASPNDRDENGYTPMHAAAEYAHLDLLRYLVSAGGEVNIKDNDGDTPLHAAEDPQAVAVLVELGADLKAVNSDGQTPLAKALAENEFPELVSALATLSGEDLPKLPENVSMRVDYQNEDTLPTSISDEQRAELGRIVENGTDADLEAFLTRVMTERESQSTGIAGTEEPDRKRTK